MCVFLVLFENDKTDLLQIFFSEFRRKHLLITTCIEKHCSRRLRIVCANVDPNLIADQRSFRAKYLQDGEEN